MENRIQNPEGRFPHLCPSEQCAICAWFWEIYIREALDPMRPVLERLKRKETEDGELR